jgi:Helix-hairpin-helix domain
MKDDQQNQARGLAFRRAAATLASLPAPVTKRQQLTDLPDVGDHCKRVIEVSLSRCGN